MKIHKKLWKQKEIYGKIPSIIIKQNKFFGCDGLKYDFQCKVIGDGVEFCSVKAEGFKTACVSFNVTLPLGENASLFALLPGILTRSAEKYPSVTLLERKLASLYGAELNTDVSKTGENQVIRISVSCIEDRFALSAESIVADCCRLLLDVVFHPDFTAGVFRKAEVESEKRILIEQIFGEKSDKRIYAKNRCEEIMCADEVYGINRLGTEKAIEEITPETLTEAYASMLKNGFITLCVSGSHTIDFDSLNKMFEDEIIKVDRDLLLAETLFVEVAEDVTYVKEQEPIKQGKLVMGFRMGMKNADDSYAARRIMTDLFGGSPHSKLFTVVREKMSLCYYCSARMLRQKGIMYVQSGIESYNEEKAKNGILQQLEDIRNGKFEEEALSYSVKALEDGFRSVSDSPESLDSWFMSQQAMGGYRYPEDFVNEFKEVTREQVIATAKDVTLDTVFMLEGTGEGEDEE